MTVDHSHHKCELQSQGFTRVKGFYSADELVPLKRGITRIIGKLYALHMGKPLPAGDFDSAAVQSAYMDMIRHDRTLGSLVYNAVKQIPEFVRLVASEKNLALASALRGSDFMGITRGGDGIRIDYPNETQFMAQWHQDYPYQLSSMDGLVFWSPLVNITMDNGPLELCPGSNLAGALPIYYSDDTAYTINVANADAQAARYPSMHATCNAGDLLVLDFLLLHRSGENRSLFPRWSLQLRYFNFNNAEATQMGWPAGVSQGNRLETFHPELVVEQGA